MSLSRSNSTRTGSSSSGKKEDDESAEEYHNRLRKERRREGENASSSRKKEDNETAEQYRNRLRKERREVGKAEVVAEAGTPGAGVTFGFSAIPTPGKGAATTQTRVYVPDVKVNPGKMSRDGRFAFNGEAWCMVERVFAARDEPREEPPLEGTLEPEPAPTKRQVLVKWVMFPKPSWEPLENLKGTDALKDFAERHGDPKDNDGPADVYQRWYKY